MDGDIWTVAEAKAKFSEVLYKACLDRSQTVTCNGRTAAIIVSPEEWGRRTRRKGSLAAVLAESPLRESGLDLEHAGDMPRKIGF